MIPTPINLVQVENDIRLVLAHLRAVQTLITVFTGTEAVIDDGHFMNITTDLLEDAALSAAMNRLRDHVTVISRENS